MKRIDMDTWDRRDQYAHFAGMDCPYWGLTCEIEVTPARRFMKRQGIPSYVGMIYLMTKTANAVPELRQRIQDGDVVEYEVTHPSFTLLNDRGQLCFCQTPYVADPAVFAAQARRVMDEARTATRCPLADPRQDLVYLSCLPWVHFTALTHPVHFHPPDAIPRITWGRFEERGESTLLAVNLQVNHALADGYHVSLFMQTLGELCAAPEKAFPGVRAG